MRLRHLPAIALASLVSMTASAVPTTYEFSAVWTGARGSTVPEWFDFGLANGALLTGSFTIETDTAPEYADATFGVYYNPVTALTFDAGGTGPFTLGDQFGNGDTRSSSIDMFDEYTGAGAPFDEFDINIAVGSAPGDPLGLRRLLAFNGYSGEWVPGNLFTSGLPTPESALARAQDPDFLSHLQLNFSVTQGSTPEDYRWAGVTAQVTDLHVVTASVPEPATLSLLGAGLLGALAIRRRRRVVNA